MTNLKLRVEAKIHSTCIRRIYFVSGLSVRITKLPKSNFETKERLKLKTNKKNKTNKTNETNKKINLILYFVLLLFFFLITLFPKKYFYIATIFAFDSFLVKTNVPAIIKTAPRTS